MLKAKLVVIGGEAKAAEISLSLPTIIGRGRDANLTLPHPLVSRQHCELFEKDGMLHVRDLKSLNGTYVDSQRIETSLILKPDQLLTIGNVTFRAIYSLDDASVAEVDANTSNVIEIDSVSSSADSDSQIDGNKQGTIHSRPTVRGNKKPAAKLPSVKASGDPLQTISASDISNKFSPTSDVLDEFGPENSTPIPQHSVVAALNQAGVTTNPRDDATISDIRTQLPDEIRPEASNIEGLVVDPAETPAEQAQLSSLELDEKPSDKVESDESALGSFIRKIPR